MRSKGFTLVELLTVLVLLSLIGLFSYPLITKTIKERRSDLYNIQVDNIKSSAADYINKNSLIKDNDKVIITLCQLKQNGFVDSDIKNPVNGTLIPDDSKITVQVDNSGNKYDFVYGSGNMMSCSQNSTTLFEYVEVGSTYSETTDISNLKSFKINGEAKTGSIKNYINMKKLGTYVIEYIFEEITIIKNLYIVDTTAPTIVYKESHNGTKEITGLITIDANSSFSPFEVTVKDNSGEGLTANISSNINSKIPGNYFVTYSAVDSSGNKTVKTQSVLVKDDIGPVIDSVEGVTGVVTSSSILVTINAHDVGVGLSKAGAYSFDGGETWQTSPSKTFDQNTKFTVAVRDKVGNITKRTYEIDRIIKEDISVSYNVVSGNLKNNGWYITNVEVQVKPIINSEMFKSMKYCITNDINGCTPNIAVNDINGKKVVLSENSTNTLICGNVIHNGGTSKTICSANFKIDNISPKPIYSIKSEKHNEGYLPWYVSDVELEIKTDAVSGIESLKYCTTTGASCTPNKVGDDKYIIGSQSKTNKVCAIITNKAGVTGGSVCSSNYQVDKNQPSIELSAVDGYGKILASGNYVGKEINFTVSVTPSHTPEVSGYRYDWYKNDAIYKANGGSTLKITNEDDLLVTDVYKVIVTTGAGNKDEATMSLVVDTKKPTCSISVISGKKGENNWYITEPTAELKTNDEGSGIQSYDLTQSDAASYNDKKLLSLSTGKNNVYGYVKDKVGNTGTCRTSTPTIDVDTVVPTCSIVYGDGFSSSVWKAGKIFQINSSNNVSGVTSNIVSNRPYNQRSPIILGIQCISDSHCWNQFDYLPYTVSGSVKSGAGLTGSCSLTDSTTDSSQIKSVSINSGSYTPGTWSNKDVPLSCSYVVDTGMEPRSGLYIEWSSKDVTINNQSTNYVAQITSKYYCVVRTGVTPDGEETEDSIEVKIDKTQPTVSISGKKETSGTAVASGSWSNQNVVLTANVNPTSTPSEYTYSWTRNGNYAGKSESVTAADSGTYKVVVTTGAGNKAEASFEVNIDKVKPTCRLSVTEGTLGNDNWYKSSRVVVSSSNDSTGSSLSGYGVSTGSKVYNSLTSYSVTSNTTGITINCYVKDMAGNEGNNSITIKKDSGGGGCTLLNEPTTWNNDAYYYPLYGTTFTSGCPQHWIGMNGFEAIGKGCYYKANMLPIKRDSVVRTIVWSSAVLEAASGARVTCPSRTVNLWYDGEKPVCGYSGENTTWTNQNVTLEITCADGDGSGCKSSEIPLTISWNTEKYTMKRTITDNAGNSVECSKEMSVMIDKAKPRCTVTKTSVDSSLGVSGYITASDTGGSGLKSSEKVNFYYLTESKSYTFEDNAGNSTTCTVDVSNYKNYRKRTCSVHSSCQNQAACGYNYCQSWQCGWDTCLTGSNTCKSGYSAWVSSGSSFVASASCSFSTSSYSSCSKLPTGSSYKTSQCIKSGNLGTSICNAIGFESGTCYVKSSCSRNYSSCMTGSNTCKGGWKSCETSACGVASCVNDSCECETWGSYGDWSNNICVPVANKVDCWERTLYR